MLRRAICDTRLRLTMSEGMNRGYHTGGQQQGGDVPRRCSLVVRGEEGAMAESPGKDGGRKASKYVK
jgi:hypothetical protein